MAHAVETFRLGMRYRTGFWRRRTNAVPATSSAFGEKPAFDKVYEKPLQEAKIEIMLNTQVTEILGKEKVTETASSLAVYYAYVTQFKKWCGLVVRDDRKVARIANIETSTTGSNRFDEDILIRALRHGRFDKRKTRLYCNPYLAADLDIRAKDKGNIQWSTGEIFGKKVTMFLDIPIRVLDENIITASESQVT